MIDISYTEDGDASTSIMFTLQLILSESSEEKWKVLLTMLFDGKNCDDAAVHV